MAHTDRSHPQQPRWRRMAFAVPALCVVAACTTVSRSDPPEPCEGRSAVGSVVFDGGFPTANRNAYSLISADGAIAVDGELHQETPTVDGVAFAWTDSFNNTGTGSLQCNGARCTAVFSPVGIYTARPTRLYTTYALPHCER